MTGASLTSSVGRKVSRWLVLSWPERRVVAGTMLLLPVIWIGLRGVGFVGVHAWAAGPRRARERPLQPIDPVDLGVLVGMAGRHVPFASTCLTRSLALAWLLARRGIACRLRIGVRTAAHGLESHAWVEQGGRPINDAPDIAERFAVLSSTPPAVPPA